MKCKLRSRGIRHACTIEQDESKIYFRKAPYAMKGEIKAMKGARWNGNYWTVSRCPRNLFQIRAMMVEPENPNPYAHFEQELVELPDHKDRPLAPQQIDMLRRALTYHYQLIAAEMGLGKSLFAIELMERIGGRWVFVGPKSALESVKLDRYKWKSTEEAELITYERLRIDRDELVKNPPLGIIFDECTALKNPASLTGKAAQSVADAIRATHGLNGFVICMSGTMTAKRPSDIWSQAEVVWPGFLREGSLKAFESRYAKITMHEDMDGVKYPVLEGWVEHEVKKIPSRLDGLMTTYFKKDWLPLPDRHFEVRKLEPSKRLTRIAGSICDAAPNTISALTSLRALSSGFQYAEDQDGGTEGERGMVETKCPKDDQLREILAEEESRGRIITFASFQGSIDRVRRICQGEGWDVVAIDGRGWICYKDGEKVKDHVLDFWANNPTKTALVGNPASCRFGLTLVEAKTTVYFDQGFSAEHRLQSMDRNYRMGQDQDVRVVDLIHLPVDQLVLDTLTENRRLEDLSLGRIREMLRQTV